MDIEDFPDDDPAVELLQKYAGRRVRVVDDHMFAVDLDPGSASFRLQLYKAEGLRSVAVVTQVVGEGMCLSWGAERFVEAVWRRHCPESAEPPLWVEYQLLDGVDPDRCLIHQRFEAGGGRLKVDGPPFYGPPLTFAALGVLVGQTVASDRGSGFIPKPDPIADQVKMVESAHLPDLPTPRLNGKPPCMPGTQTEWIGTRGRASYRQPGLSCCWYHGGDWAEVSQIGRRLLAQAHADGVEPADVWSTVADLAAEERLPRWSFQALDSLLRFPIQPSGDNDYTNGRHRVQAMLDQQVEQTLIVRWRSITDPVGDPGRGRR